MFANWVFIAEVDERSVFGVGKTGFVIDRLDEAVCITQIQVPPRPPKKDRQSLDCLSFYVLLA